MSQTTVERTIWVAAPQERVWKAISQPDELARWFLPPSMGAGMRLDEQGVLTIMLGPMGIDLAQVEHTDAPRSITLRNLPDRKVTVTYALQPEDGGTRVTVTMGGLEALPRGALRERLDPTSAGWEKALQNLKAHLSGRALPHPEGWSAALFGYRLEAPNKLEVERSIWIDAPRERVWHAITDADEMTAWFSPGAPWVMSEFAVGGRFYIVDEATGAENYVQFIDLIEPPSRFVTRSAPEPPEVPHVSDWTLVPEDGGTRLTITYSGYERDPEYARHDGMEQNAFGFGVMLQNIKAHIEGQPLPMPGGF